MKKNNISFIFILLMLGALLGAVVLVKQSQETRKSAFFASTNLLVGSPGQSFSANIGDDLLVPVFINTEKIDGTDDYAKVDFAKITLCYGDELDLVEDDSGYIDHLINFNRDAFDVLLLAKVESDCLTFTVKSEKSADRLKSGMFEIATVRFRAMDVGNGTISIDRNRTQASGSNPDMGSNDMALRLGELRSADYEIGSGDNTPIPTATDMPGATNTPIPTATDVPGATNTPIPTATDMPGATNTPIPTATDVPGATNTPVPTDTPMADVSKLNFVFTFVGVKSAHAKCAVSWPIQVTVMKNELKKVYTDVVTIKTGDVNSSDEIVYYASVELVDFNETKDVMVFIKGPKHLQMKYAKDNQDGPYGKAGGELDLIDSDKIYDFTQYPLLAGDVNQDGWVNGIDFSLVKAAAVEHIEIEEGGYLLKDLDGSCQANTADTTLLVKSLDARQEELY